MKILKVISLLMGYPTEELREASAELQEAIEAACEIPPAMRGALTDLLGELCEGDLFDVQEAYGGLFDRGRATSLLLFEHVHGESRDRGQAMVDLLELYRSRGLEIGVRELPDYIPLYLEYLAGEDDTEARCGLADVAHILGMLSARLQERGSRYHCLFDALLTISGQAVDSADLRQKAAREERDDTPEALDRLWEEEAVKFTAPDMAGGPACGQSQAAGRTDDVQPLRWVESARPAANKQAGA